MNCTYCCRDAGSNYVCPHCGTILRSPTPIDLDRGGLGPIVLGLLLPVIGIPLSVAWRRSKPKSSSQLMTASIVSLVLCGFAFVGIMYWYYVVYLGSLFNAL